MRSLSFIIAFCFALAGPSFSASKDTSIKDLSTKGGELPGIGTFSYGGTDAASDTPLSRLARLTLTKRA